MPIPIINPDDYKDIDWLFEQESESDVGCVFSFFKKLQDSKAYSIKAACIIGLIGLLKRISVDTDILKPTIKARNFSSFLTLNQDNWLNLVETK